MKKRTWWQKPLALLLTLVLVLSCLPQNVQANEGGEHENIVRIGYDSGRGSVQIEGKRVGDWEEYKVVPGRTYNISLIEKPETPEGHDCNEHNWENCPYGDRGGSKPVVHVYGQDGETQYTVDDNGDADENTWHFTYNPADGEEICVYWSEYDAYGYDDLTQFQIEMPGDICNGTVTVQKNGKAVTPDFSCQYGAKYTFAVEDAEKVSIKMVPDEGAELEEYGWPGIRYKNRVFVDPNQPDNPDEKVEYFDVDADGTYTFHLSKEDLYRYRWEDGQDVLDIDDQGNQRYNCLSLWANFWRESGPEYNENEVRVEFDGWQGSIYMDETEVISWENYEIDKERTYQFYLTEKPNRPEDHDCFEHDWDNCPYGDRGGSKPVVRVNGRDGETQYTVDDCGDQDENTWHFTYNPADGNEIHVYWSEYDAYDYDMTTQFQIEMMESIENGTVTVKKNGQKATPGIQCSYGVKYTFDVDDVVEMTFTPDEGAILYELGCGRLWMKNRSYLNPDFVEDGIEYFDTKADGSYTIRLTKENFLRYRYEDGQEVLDQDGEGNQLYERFGAWVDFFREGESGEEPDNMCENHDYQMQVKVAPTCTEDGLGYEKCTICGHNRPDEPIPAKGHTYDSGKVTKAATVTSTGIKTFTCKVKDCGATKTETIAKLAVKAGYLHKDTKNNIIYKVTNASKKTVSVKAPANVKGKSVTIASTVKIAGKTYTVNGIDGNAFKGCKKLKKITIKSTKLTTKTVAKTAFKSLGKGTTIKVPKSKLSAYKKLFKSKGLSSKVKVTK